MTAPQKLHFAYGPIHVNAGQNMIQYSGANVPKPKVDGWITAITPNLILPNGTVPAVELVPGRFLTALITDEGPVPPAALWGLGRAIFKDRIRAP